jgi:predicted hydrolase (HD superfamily)
VARRAEAVAHIVGEDADVLVCAAWLHDIGYSPELAVTGFHPLDGARYLRDVVGADPRLCGLVAHHSCAIIEARRRGLAGELASEFPEVGGLLADALTYCDMTTSPAGTPVTVDNRLTEIVGRYGDGHLVSESIQDARTAIERSVRAVHSVMAQ